MVDVTTILIGVIFFIIILIIIVYFVYFNRKIAPTSVITDNGISLTSVSFPNLLITDEATELAGSGTGTGFLRNIMVLQTASGSLPSGAQGWVFLNANQLEVTAFTLVVPPTSTNTGDIVTIQTGDKVFIRNAYTGGYVSYSTTDPHILADNLEITSAVLFTIEFDVVNQIMALQSTLVTGQYLIPTNTSQFSGDVIMGVPTATNGKNWFINKKPS